MTKQKTVIIGPAFPLRGGIADLNESLARSLQQKGHDVLLYSFSYQYPKFLFPGKTQFREGPAPADLNIETCIHSLWPFNWLKVARKIKKEKPSLVIVRYWIPVLAPVLGFICRRLRKFGLNVICIADNVTPHESWCMGDKLNKYFLNSVDHFLVMSNAVKEDLLDYRPEAKFVKSPHPVYHIFGDLVSKAKAKEALGLDANTPYMLFFGFIRRYKGLKLLLESMAESNLPKVNLLVAGEFYEDKEEYLKLIDELKLKDRVHIFSSFIPAEEVKNYFCAADIVVQPYLSATQSGITQIAYNFNRPMLVTDVGGLAEWIPTTVGYVTKVDKVDIAKALEDFYQNNREAAMTKAAEAYKEQFSWEHFSNQLLTLAEQIK